MPGVGTVPDVADPESDLDWIDAAIGSFCRWRSVDKQFADYRNARAYRMNKRVDVFNFLFP